MIELPEALTLARQMRAAVAGKSVHRVLPPVKPHKFCWFSGDPADYDRQLRGARVLGAEGFGIYAQITFDNGKKLCVNDGVNPRLLDDPALSKNHQLLIEFDDGAALSFTVAMYGGICLFEGDYDDPYYQASRASISPFSPEFPQRYFDALNAAKPSLSAKAFLATQQRFAGIGNGVCQDILFAAGIHPKRRLDTLDAADRERLLSGVVSVLDDMTRKGGRDTEKDLFANPGGYATRMSKNTLAAGCPTCAGPIVKETYLGGSVYYCPHCQPLKSLR